MRRMVDNMKSYKVTKSQIDIINDALERYLKYVDECCIEYADFFKDMNATNELYKKNLQHFFNDNGIDQDKFFRDYEEYQLALIAKKVLEEVENIHTNVISIFIDPSVDKIKYPINIHHWVFNFKRFCFDDDGNFLSLEMQNQKLVRYPYYDASTKKPKTFATQGKS